MFSLQQTSSFFPILPALLTLKDAVRCLSEDTCFIWTTVYRKISNILEDICLENVGIGQMKTTDFYNVNWNKVLSEQSDIFLVRNGKRLFELINGVIVRVVEGGILNKSRNEFSISRK